MTPRLPTLEFVEERLDNGLQVIVHRNCRVPLVHLSLHYRVGSVSEPPGLSGLAHLFEHMMFQGSANVGKNEHGRLIDGAGGVWNASTGKERTHYHETLPSRSFELALWLEADRMRSLAVTEENFENQRRTVIEEKKQNYDNRPYGSAQLQFDLLAYPDWRYGHPVIGFEEDLERATIEDARDFHRTFYGPGNATLVLAGDLEEKTALKAVRHHFGDIPDRTAPPAVDPEVRSHRSGKTVVLDDRLARLPAVWIAYAMAGATSPDHRAMTLLGLILAEGDSSRLLRKLVFEENRVTGLYASPAVHRGPSLFRVWAQLQQDVPVSDVIGKLDQELDRIVSHKVRPTELAKARNQVRFRLLSRLERISRTGELLAHAASVLGDAALAVAQFEQMMEIPAEEIRDTAARILRPADRILLEVRPSRGKEAGV